MKNNITTINNFASANEICNEILGQSGLNLTANKYFRVLKVTIHDADWKWSKLHNVFMDGSKEISNFINSIINKVVEKIGDQVTIDTNSERHGNVEVTNYWIKVDDEVIYTVKIEDFLMDLENENLF